MNVSREEFPRALYAWSLRFLLQFGYVVGWTVLVAVAVTRFSIHLLPVILLVQAFFAIGGTLLFSVLVERLEGRQILVVNTLCAMLMLCFAFLSFHNDIPFMVFTLLASGIFLSQVSIILSNYIEDFFTPLEAERIVPAVESAETIGGIVGGVFLAYVAFSSLGAYLMLFWVLCLALFLAVLFFCRPQLPFYLKELDEKSEGYRSDSLGWNAIAKSIDEIKRVPFLQILLTVLIFHGVISQFVEFLYTKAVDESVHTSAGADHEASLAHGLGILHIFLHGSALVVELFISSRVVRSLGTFAGFMVHVVTTFLSGVAMVFGFGYVTAVLARNNFEMTTVIQRNAYETSYYAFKYGTLRSLREFFEGIIFPMAAVVGTILILGIESFFLEAHLPYVIPFFVVSLALGMGVFALQLQKHYTNMAIENLYSKVPITRYRAVEIISQRGHRNSYEHLVKVFHTSDDVRLQKKIVRAFGFLGGEKAAEFLVNLLESEKRDLFVPVLESCIEMGKNVKRTASGKRIRALMVQKLQTFLALAQDDHEKVLAVRALVHFDPHILLSYLNSVSSVLRAEVAMQLWNVNLHKATVKGFIADLLRDQNRESLKILAHVSGHIPVNGIGELFEKYAHSSDEELRLFSYLTFLQCGDRRYLSNLMNLLLEGNEVIFKKGLVFIRRMNRSQKRKIAHSLMPIAYNKKKDQNGDFLLERVGALYEACDAPDHTHYIRRLVTVPFVS